MRCVRDLASVVILFAAVGCSSTAADTSDPGTGGGAPSDAASTSSTSTVSSAHGGGSAAGGGGPAPTAQQACEDGANATCQRDQDCTGGMIITYVFGDMATCVSTRIATCLASLGAPGTGSTPITKEACAKDTPAETCVDTLDGNDSGACITPPGTADEGSPCIGAAQCKSTWCAFQPNALCGVCAALPKEGDACNSVTACPSGLSCNTTTKRCQVPVNEGGACSASAACDTFLACDDGGSGTGNGTCTALPAKLGASCNPNVGCDLLHGLVCLGAGNTCTAVTFAGPGEPCALVSSTSYVFCRAGGICNAGSAPSGTCVGTVPVGETCDVVFGPTCDPGLTCATANPTTNTGTCRAFDPSLCVSGK